MGYFPTCRTQPFDGRAGREIFHLFLIDSIVSRTINCEYVHFFSLLNIYVRFRSIVSRNTILLTNEIPGLHSQAFPCDSSIFSNQVNKCKHIFRAGEVLLSTFSPRAWELSPGSLDVPGQRPLLWGIPVWGPWQVCRAGTGTLATCSSIEWPLCPMSPLSHGPRCGQSPGWRQVFPWQGTAPLCLSGTAGNCLSYGLPGSG